MKRKISPIQLLTIFLGVGFFIGIIYENVKVKHQGITIRIFQPFFLQKYLKTKVIEKEYFWYVVRTRIFSFAVCVFLRWVKWKKIFVALVIGWTGFLCGILTVSSILQFGAKGIFLCMMLCFPHFILYALAYEMLLIYLYQYPESTWNSAKTVFVLAMMLLGIILETYINPVLLKGAIKIVM